MSEFLLTCKGAGGAGTGGAAGGGWLTSLAFLARPAPGVPWGWGFLTRLGGPLGPGCTRPPAIQNSKH